MAVAVTSTTTNPRRRPGSMAALLMGFVTVLVLSLCTDQVLHVLKVYPPWNQPMNDPGLNLLALAYRCAYAVLGSYIAARLAPQDPMWHALALGVIGFVLSVVGLIATLPLHLGPVWYPAAIVLTALPCAWLGGVLHGTAPARS